MDIRIISRRIEVTKGMETALVNSLDFLEKFLKEDTIVQARVNVEKNTHKIEILFPYQNEIIKIEEKSDDFYVTVGLISEKLKNTMSKLHELHIEQNKLNLHEEFKGYKDFNYSISNKELNNTKGRIVKRKGFSMKPMSEEEAILQMELLGHSSFIFSNADLDFGLCLLYKRKDGNYGIIETIYDEDDEF